MAYSFGGATLTGIAYVTMFMDVLCDSARFGNASRILDVNGHANDHTGRDKEGGGGILGEAANAAMAIRCHCVHENVNSSNVISIVLSVVLIIIRVMLRVA
jgi:hypothetical protein